MPEIALRRLHSQHIANTSLTSPRLVVAWLGAMQGQDYPGAKWSIGLRLPQSSDAEVEAAIERREIVRTWAMRGTLHLVAAEDVHWLLKLVSPSISVYHERVSQEMDLETRTLVRAYDLMLGAMAGGQAVERRALLALLEAHGIPSARERGRHYLHRASSDGLIAQGVMRGNNPTFFALDTLPNGRDLTRAEALAELARRYFTSRGPATVPDFANWAAIPLAEARAGLEAVKTELVEDKVGSVSYWLSPSGANATTAAPSVYALPGFDEFLLGYKERGASLEKAHYSAWCPGKNGIFSPTIVSDGRVVGMWKRTLKRNTVQIEAAPLRPLRDDERAGFEADAQRYAAFLGLEAVFTS